MKTIKEEQKKVTKDVLLHQIFEEISEEEKEMHDTGYLDEIIPSPKKSLSKIRKLQAKRQWFFIALLVSAIVYMLFNMKEEPTQSSAPKISNDTYTVQLPQENYTVIKKEKNQPLNLFNQEVKEAPVIQTTTPVQTIAKNRIEEKVQDNIVLKTEEPQTQREKAKKALLLQMQN
ncbi:MAG: hypothetical protein U9O64_04720 [Campylobacterota bacterium]|nr:hypothetical protein [Campylobacterota bacterium]